MQQSVVWQKGNIVDKFATARQLEMLLQVLKRNFISLRDRGVQSSSEYIARLDLKGKGGDGVNTAMLQSLGVKKSS